LGDNWGINLSILFMTKQEAKQKIQNLVAKYEAEKSAGKIAKYSEEETKRGFIEPLFEALGWNFSSKEEITLEEQISGDRVDYGFYLNSRIKFYLEAKPFKADLHREDYAKQSIKYSWNKGVTWAVLADFESLIVFNALSPEKSLAGKRYFEIPYTEFLERFDQLWLLSKESFLSDSLDKEAEKHGKKLQKISVTEKLAEDLNYCRKELTEAFRTWNKDVPDHLIDEGVQKLLDRLIFIRVAEDRKIEPPTLIPLLHQWKSSGEAGKTSPYQAMIEKFRELDKIYNSNLFSPHPFEKWEEFSGATEKVINKLYGDKDYFEYDFSAIPADVLGAVYENYLGYRLEQTKKKLFDQDLDLTKSHKKRKEQGIYYTPKFIVDYIVQNVLGPILDKCKSVNDLQKIKILDPACGSGSFLVAAMNFLIKKYEEFGAKPDGFLKIQILQSNIYGVDLDEQAVELARLNLLLNTFDSQTKLPNLGGNIKNGNSLISGTDEELEKFFGKNFRDKKPFNWQEQFPEVFKQDGFDCVIGNPPYVRNRELPEDDKKYFNGAFVSAQGQYDIYQLFFERSINILKKHGQLGFITSNKYAVANYGKKLREFILENSKIISIVDVSHFEVFKDAATYPYVIVLQKDSENSRHLIHAFRANESGDLKSGEIIIQQDEIKSTSTKNFTIKNEPNFFKDIEKISVKLGDIATIKETIHTGNVRKKLIVDEPVDKTCKKLLAGKDCHRYWFKWAGKYIRYDKSLIDKERGDYANLIDPKYFEEPKILLRELALNIECCLDNEKFYTLNKVYSVQNEKGSEYDLNYILCLLNSKLLSYYFRQKFEEAHVQGGYLQFKKIYTSQILVRKIDFKDKIEKEQHDNIAKMAEKMTKLHEEFNVAAENSDEWQKIKDEISQTDQKIDQEVYKLYGLTDKEIVIVERGN
jgi:methylase of polypeptide subunit release factors